MCNEIVNQKPTIDQMLDYLQTNMSVFLRAGLKDVVMRCAVYL